MKPAIPLNGVICRPASVLFAALGHVFLSLFAVGLVMLVLYGCSSDRFVSGTPFTFEQFDQIHIGMYPAEVVGILGEPYHQYYYATGQTWIWNHTTSEQVKSLAVVFTKAEQQTNQPPIKQKDVRQRNIQEDGVQQPARSKPVERIAELKASEISVYNEFADSAAYPSRPVVKKSPRIVKAPRMPEDHCDIAFVPC